MGAQAPDVITLIRTNLQERDARGLAEDYLDAVGWPQAEPRVKFRARGGPRRRMPVHLRRTNDVEAQLRAPTDPTRN
jgi:hypothetical protein